MVKVMGHSTLSHDENVPFMAMHTRDDVVFLVFGQPFVKRFALYAIRPLSVCPVLSVCL